ncbi:alpha/beta hydrolase [Kitasatospora sp. MAP5-34]|uniref:alpha/beta fold hydrolase n=1 Tax=Kitasatospora sp. MAP5-34 TaxID=3035102 RepID=UPI0024741F0F|nr:alpha/beta hydrolase [Kitasatospora sp. MAP5-34]MDH6576240.1 N-formylmaleamate deformylase [Kitasatospora sp. MAP5-34]
MTELGHRVTAEQRIDGLAVLDHGGDGPDVLLLHGANRTALDWGPVLPHLPGLRLVAMDLRGHGRSALASSYTWDDHLGDVDAVIHGLGLRRPWLVGHSLGGMIAVRYAASRECAGVVDLDGFGGGMPASYPGLTPQQVGERRAEQIALFASAPAVTDPGQLEARARATAERFGWDAEREVARVRRSAGRPLPGELPALMAPLDGYDLFAEVRGLRVPVLLVAGERMPDLGHLPQHIRELNEALVLGIGAELAALPDRVGVARLKSAGHMVHLDAPVRVAVLIREFVKQSGRERDRS